MGLQLPTTTGDRVEYKPGDVTYSIALDTFGYLDARCSICTVAQYQFGQQSFREPRTVAYCAGRAKSTDVNVASVLQARIDEHDRSAHRADSPRCDICGKLLDPVAPDACLAGWDYEDEIDCNGTHLRGDPRDHARVAKLRAALERACKGMEDAAVMDVYGECATEIQKLAAELRKENGL